MVSSSVQTAPSSPSTCACVITSCSDELRPSIYQSIYRGAMEEEEEEEEEHLAVELGRKHGLGIEAVREAVPTDDVRRRVRRVLGTDENS